MEKAKTFTPCGHLLAHDDHGLTAGHLEFIDVCLSDLHRFPETLKPFEIHRSVHYMPEHLDRLPCDLYGTVCGDYPISEACVHYRRRNNRPGLSRCVNWEPRPADYMAIVAKRDGEAGGLVVLTAYGCMNGDVDRLAPREWWDVGMKPYEAAEAAQFWKSHALADPAGLPDVDQLDHLERRFFNHRHIVELADPE